MNTQERDDRRLLTIAFKVKKRDFDFVKHTVRTLLKQLGYKLNNV